VADVVSSEVRSRMMSGIRGKNTRPELILRSGLHRRGFRFRLHRSDLPGKPDLIFPKHRAVLFAHGCFWHGHECHLFKWPSSRAEFWKNKIEGNRMRDIRALESLEQDGWRIGIVWECALKGVGRQPVADILDRCEGWLTSGDNLLEIAGVRV
jgi:DNA mismatch endonuclease, patch repair protein